MSKLSRTKKDIMKEFCNDVSISSCNFTRFNNLSRIERIMWVIFNTVLIFLMSWLVVHLVGDFMESPTVTALVSSSIPIQNVTHPGVSICNMNKFSKQRAYKFAEYLNAKYYNNKKNISAILNDIKLLGSLYDFRRIHRAYREFQSILELDYDNLADGYDPAKHIEQLTTPCSEMLRKCYWSGGERNCNELFFTRTTYEGPCCVFNYMKPGLIGLSANKSEVPQGSGVLELGLRVILNNNLDDYFYSGTKTQGFNVHIFEPYDFPDKLSGSLTEIIVNAGFEALIGIEVDVIQSTSQVRMLPMSKRKCTFEDEQKTILGMQYRESDCNVDCRVKIIISLCKCVPIMLPGTIRLSAKVPKCNLLDIPCLNKYKEKWSRYYPHGAETESNLEGELLDSISCQCDELCNSVTYNVHTSINAIQRIENVTHVIVYFTKPFVNLYKIDLLFTWFEMLSSFGGIVALCIGISFISVVEILALGVKLVKHYIHNYNK